MAQYNVSKKEAKEQGIERVLIDGGNKSGGDSSYQDLVDEILGTYDGKTGATQSFEDYDEEHPELGARDRSDAEALFKPFYEQQIADTMEDLNVWQEMEVVDYNRTLRQGRAKMAKGGGAIGSERTQWEGEVKQDSDYRRAGEQRRVERQVGSEEVSKAGMTSLYDGRKGTVIDEMDAAIKDQELWYRDQRSQRFNYDAESAYRG